MSISAVDPLDRESSTAQLDCVEKKQADIETKIDAFARESLTQPNASKLSSQIHAPSPLKDAKILTSFAGGSSSVPADVSSVIRSLPFSSLQTSYMPTLMSGSSVLNTVTGAVGALESYANYKKYSEMGANSLAKDSAVALVGSVAQSAAGIAVVANRPLNVLGAIENIPATPSSSSLIGRVNFFTGSISGGLFGILSLCFSYLSFTKLKSLWHFKAHLKTEAKEGSTEKIAHFLALQSLSTSSEQVLKNLYTKFGGDVTKIRQELRANFTKQIDRWMRSFSKELRAVQWEEDVQFIENNSKALADRIFSSMSDESRHALRQELQIDVDAIEPNLKELVSVLSAQELHGLKIATSQEELKKFEELSSQVGNSAASLAKQVKDRKLFQYLQSIEQEKHSLHKTLSELEETSWDLEQQSFAKSAPKQEIKEKMGEICTQKMHINNRLVELDAKEKEIQSTLQTLTKEALKQINNSLVKSVFSFITCALLTISIGLSLAPLAGSFALASAVVSLAASLLSFGIDSFDMIDGRRVQGPPGKHDNKFITFNLLLDVASMAIAIAFSAIFSMGIAPAIAAAIIGICWTSINIYSYLKITEKEKLYKREKPTAEGIIDELSKNCSSPLLYENKIAYAMAKKLQYMPGFEDIAVDPTTPVQQLKDTLASKIQRNKVIKENQLKIALGELKLIL